MGSLKDELLAMMARLRQLDRENRKHTSWFGVARTELGDAMRELPRAVLAAPSELLKAGLEPARGAAPAASEGAPRTGAPEPAGTLAGPAVSTKGESRPAAGSNGVHAAPPPAAASIKPGAPCAVCAPQTHDGRRHRWRAARTAAPPAEQPTSDEEAEPAQRPRHRQHSYGSETGELGPYGHNVFICEGCGVNKTTGGPGWATFYRRPGETEWVRGLSWCMPEPTSAPELLPAAENITSPADHYPAGARPVRHFFDAPSDGSPGLSRCGVDAGLLVRKLAMVTCAECLRLMRYPCGRCGDLGHNTRTCPQKGNGASVTRAYRAEQAAKREAILDAPIELVILPAEPSNEPAKQEPEPGIISPDSDNEEPPLLAEKASRPGETIEKTSAPPPAEYSSQTSPETDGPPLRHRQVTCKRCLRPGHYARTCTEDVTAARLPDLVAACQRLGLSPPPEPRAPLPVVAPAARAARAAGGPIDRAELDALVEEFGDPNLELPPEPPRAPTEPALQLTTRGRIGRPRLGRDDLGEVTDDELEALTEKEAAAFRAVVIEGRSTHEVGEEEGVRRDVINSRVHNARDRLAANRTAARMVMVPGRPSNDPTPAQAMMRRHLHVIQGEARPRARTLSTKRGLSRDEQKAAERAELLDTSAYDRPTTRADCEDEARPCPWVSCRFHLAVDVDPGTGALKLTAPWLEVWEMKETCALDVADRGGLTLEEVGDALHLTRERVRQIEVLATTRLKRRVEHGKIALEDPAGTPVGNVAS